MSSPHFISVSDSTYSLKCLVQKTLTDLGGEAKFTARQVDWTGFLYIDEATWHAQCLVYGKESRTPINFQRELHGSSLRRKGKIGQRGRRVSAITQYIGSWKTVCSTTFTKQQGTWDNTFVVVYLKLSLHCETEEVWKFVINALTKTNNNPNKNSNTI